MKRLAVLALGLLLSACIGGRLYFDKPTRYDVKLSMLKMKKHYEVLQSWSNGVHMDRDPAVSVDHLMAESEFLLKLLPDKNPVIWQETIRQMQQTLEFMGDSVKLEQKKRTGYHFRNLKKSCTDCHVRFRVGFNF